MLTKLLKIYKKAIFVLVVVLFFPAWVIGQTISGSVIAEDGETLIGATVLIKGTTIGTITGIDGTFSLNIEGSGEVLVASYIGYIPQEIPIKNQRVFNFILEKDIRNIDEVVFVGYGTQRKSDITGAVGSVSKDRIENVAVTDIAQMIQGSVPGLTVITTEAGADPDGQSGVMLIRGRNSISASTDPLLILDGMPYNGSLSDISPQDVASIEVLKDASSVAIYGSRGSNGVILITTKKGKEGKTQVKYDGFYSVQNVVNFPQIMNGKEYLDYKNNWTDFEDPDEALQGLSTSEREVYDDGSWKTWTWKDIITQMGESSRHNLSVSGGTKDFKYSIATSYLSTKGIVIDDEYKRVTNRVNLETNITDWLTMSSSNMLTWKDRSGAIPRFTDVFNKSPLMRPFNEDGSINIMPDSDNEKRINPIESQLYDDYNIDYNLNSNLAVIAEIAKGFSYRINGNIQYGAEEDYQYLGLNTAAKKSVNGWGSMENTMRRSYAIENILNYQHDFGEHHLFLTALYSFENVISRKKEQQGENFPNDLLSYWGMASAGLVTNIYTNYQTALISQMFRANYSYSSRYLFTATARRDGYSGFGANNKYGVFPSLAIGWNVSNEAFFEPLKDIMNTLKLRLSIGESGNQAISAFQTISRLDNMDYILGSSLAAGYNPSTLGTPSLSWETTRSGNIGIDFAFLKSRINGQFDIYQNDTYDLLLNRSISAVNGITSIYQNIGKTRNQGLEFSIASDNIRKNKFGWSSGFNMSILRTEIVDLYGDGLDDVDNGWFIGYPIKVAYDYYIVGVWQEDEADLAAQYGALPGYARYDDLNNNGEYDAGDRQIIGSTEPNFSWSFSNTFDYGPLQLNIYMYGTRGTIKSDPFRAKNYYVVKDFWRTDNPSENMWSTDSYSNQYIAAKTITPDYYESANFWRVKDLTLSYRAPKSFMSKLGVQGVKFYVTGKNLMTFTKYNGMDPELGDQRAIPLQREFIFGLNFTL
ncbi:MAG: TonB-dependent receptor [Bacteroidales bacterium]|nr:TonB-dependent receptor [Bacteroidales bacterium]MCF8390134.1 TonB-dependent receptor [Bacteroidales bacterium]